MQYPSGTPTQSEIIAIVLSKLCIRPSDSFADIGCGSGSVSISAARFARHVYAIDSREEAYQAASRNIRESGMDNITLMKGDAEDLLEDLIIDCAFVGGSRNIHRVLEILIKKGLRFAVSAVRLETVASVLEIMKLNSTLKEVIQVQISRGGSLAGGTMLKPENPVFLIIGGGPC